MLRVVAIGCAAALLWLGQRQGELPEGDGFPARFPSELGRPDGGSPPEQRVKVMTPLVEVGTASPCQGVAPEDQLSCPLTDKVVAIEPITQGVRLLVRRGPSANKLRDQLVCQVSLASAKPDTPPPCSFLGPDVNLVVRPRGKSTTAVEILPAAPDGANVGLLQERVETAFPQARRAPR